MIPSLNIIDIFRHDKNFQAIMKNMLQTMFEISFEGVMITESGPNYPIIYVNPAFCELTGYSNQELVGKSPALLQGEKSDQNVLAELKLKIEKGEIFHGKTVNYRKDGSEFMMEWKIVPIRDEEDQISHYLAIQRESRGSELEFSSLGSHLTFDQSR